jgi:hypothetical protein
MIIHVYSRIGEHGEVRGLWFHDKAFMSIFVRAIEKIYRESGLPCEGTFETRMEQLRTPNTASGQAILQMLKKGDVSPSTSHPVQLQRTRYQPATGNILELLRQELAGPQFPPPPPPVPVPPNGVTSIQINAQAVSRFPIGSSSEPSRSDFFYQPDAEVYSVTRSQLRDALREVFLSDKFMDHLIERMIARPMQ